MKVTLSQLFLSTWLNTWRGGGRKDNLLTSSFRISAGSGLILSSSWTSTPSILTARIKNANKSV